MLPDEKSDNCARCGFRRDCRTEEYMMQVARRQAAARLLEADDSLSEVVSDLVHIQSEKKRVEEAEKTIKSVLKEKLGERQKVAVPATGKRIDFADQQGGEKWDASAINAILPRLPEDIRKFLESSCKMPTAGNRPLVLRDLKPSEVA